MQNKGFVGIIIAQTLSQLFLTKSADLLSADFGIFKKIYETTRYTINSYFENQQKSSNFSLRLSFKNKGDIYSF